MLGHARWEMESEWSREARGAITGHDETRQGRNNYCKVKGSQSTVNRATQSRTITMKRCSAPGLLGTLLLALLPNAS